MKTTDAATRLHLIEIASDYVRIQDIAVENNIDDIPGLVRHFVRHLHPVFVMNGLYDALYHREAVKHVLENKPFKK